MAPLVEQAMLSLLCSGLSIAATWAVNKGETLVPSTAATPSWRHCRLSFQINLLSPNINKFYGV
jgi:hypothetical protein